MYKIYLFKQFKVLMPEWSKGVRLKFAWRKPRGFKSPLTFFIIILYLHDNIIKLK